MEEAKWNNLSRFLCLWMRVIKKKSHLWQQITSISVIIYLFTPCLKLAQLRDSLSLFRRFTQIKVQQEA